MLAVGFNILGLANISSAQEDVPIPPKRPDILNVSPAYIEELRNRGKKTQDKPDNLLPLPPPVVDSAPTYSEAETQIVDITQSIDLINLLDPSNASIPLPAHKPSFNNIEPASGDNNEIDENETTLISFVLKPEQIALDKNLEYFLKTHAIKSFNENSKLKMNIYAYATPIAGEPHSDVRISLARALKVRSFLINNDIAPNRLKLSPVGSDENNSNIDRIDLIFIEM